MEPCEVDMSGEPVVASATARTGSFRRLRRQLEASDVDVQDARRPESATTGLWLSRPRQGWPSGGSGLFGFGPPAGALMRSLDAEVSRRQVRQRSFLHRQVGQAYFSLPEPVEGGPTLGQGPPADGAPEAPAGWCSQLRLLADTTGAPLPEQPCEDAEMLELEYDPTTPATFSPLGLSVAMARCSSHSGSLASSNARSSASSTSSLPSFAGLSSRITPAVTAIEAPAASGPWPMRVGDCCHGNSVVSSSCCPTCGSPSSLLFASSHLAGHFNSASSGHPVAQAPELCPAYSAPPPSSRQAGGAATPPEAGPTSQAASTAKSPSTPSQLVKEKLKNCVLNKLRSRESGEMMLSTSLSIDFASMEIDMTSAAASIGLSSSPSCTGVQALPRQSCLLGTGAWGHQSSSPLPLPPQLCQLAFGAGGQLCRTAMSGDLHTRDAARRRGADAAFTSDLKKRLSSAPLSTGQGKATPSSAVDAQFLLTHSAAAAAAVHLPPPASFGPRLHSASPSLLEAAPAAVAKRSGGPTRSSNHARHEAMDPAQLSPASCPGLADSFARPGSIGSDENFPSCRVANHDAKLARLAPALSMDQSGLLAHFPALQQLQYSGVYRPQHTSLAHYAPAPAQPPLSIVPPRSGGFGPVHLRKTMSEPSLKLRGPATGVHRLRGRPDRRHGNHPTATAVAHALAASNVPLAAGSRPHSMALANGLLAEALFVGRPNLQRLFLHLSGPSVASETHMELALDDLDDADESIVPGSCAAPGCKTAPDLTVCATAAPNASDCGPPMPHLALPRQKSTPPRNASATSTITSAVTPLPGCLAFGPRSGVVMPPSRPSLYCASLPDLALRPSLPPTSYAPQQPAVDAISAAGARSLGDQRVARSEAQAATEMAMPTSASPRPLWGPYEPAEHVVGVSSALTTTETSRPADTFRQPSYRCRLALGLLSRTRSAPLGLTAGRTASGSACGVDTSSHAGDGILVAEEDTEAMAERNLSLVGGGGNNVAPRTSSNTAFTTPFSGMPIPPLASAISTVAATVCPNSNSVVSPGGGSSSLATNAEEPAGRDALVATTTVKGTELGVRTGQRISEEEQRSRVVQQLRKKLLERYV